MRRVARFSKVRTDGLLGLELDDAPDEYRMLRDLASYTLEQPSALLPTGKVIAWGYMVFVAGVFDEPEMGMTRPIQPRPNGARLKLLQLRPVGKLVPVAVRQTMLHAPPNRLLKHSLVPPEGKGRGEADTGLQQQLANAITLRPVQSGQTYRIISPSARGLVRPELAKALETVFERFAHQCSFTSEKPLEICLTRGFKAGSPGHGEGRAADIAAVGGKSLREWKQEWDRAIASAEKLSDPQQRSEAIAAEQNRNLGYGLYKALQEHGGWRVDPKGWRPYRGVMQLFGPWTATEGPWKVLQIENPNPYQRQRLADQQWVFRAHQDHIHVAR